MLLLCSVLQPCSHFFQHEKMQHSLNLTMRGLKCEVTSLSSLSSVSIFQFQLRYWGREKIERRSKNMIDCYQNTYVTRRVSLPVVRISYYSIIQQVHHYHMEGEDNRSMIFVNKIPAIPIGFLKMINIFQHQKTQRFLD